MEDSYIEVSKRFLSLCERAAQSGGVGVPASPDTLVAECAKIFGGFLGDTSRGYITLRDEIAATYGSVAAWYQMLFASAYEYKTPMYSMKKIARISCESLRATERRHLVV